MNPPLTIERVSGHNIGDFLSLLVELALYEELPPPDIEARSRLARDILVYPPRFEAYIGTWKNQPVCCLSFFQTYSTFLAQPTLFIEDLFVLYDYRRNGFGKALFSFCQNEAMNRGCARMEWMVLSWNQTAIRFYEAMGAKKTDWDMYRLHCGETG